MTVAELAELLADADDTRPVLISVFDRLDEAVDEYQPLGVYDLPDDEANTLFIEARPVTG